MLKHMQGGTFARIPKGAIAREPSAVSQILGIRIFINGIRFSFSAGFALQFHADALIVCIGEVLHGVFLRGSIAYLASFASAFLTLPSARVILV
jgi:hypothetical protein